jgi:ankyrin repeat protein
MAAANRSDLPSTPFTSIPYEMWILIQQSLLIYDLITLARTNKELLQFCTSSAVMGTMLKRDMPKVYEKLKGKDVQDYYQAYIREIVYERLKEYDHPVNELLYACKRNIQETIREYLPKYDGRTQDGFTKALDKRGFSASYWLSKRGDQALRDEIWKFYSDKDLPHGYHSFDEVGQKLRRERFDLSIRFMQPITAATIRFIADNDSYAFDPKKSIDVQSFILAVTHNHIEMINIFLECGFDPFPHTDSDNDTPKKNEESENPEKQYPFLAGIYADQLEAVKLFMQDNIEKIHLTYGHLENTALHYAAQWGKKEIVEELLKHKASLSVCNKEQKTPVYFAAAAGRYSMIRFLFKVNAELVLAQCASSDTTLSLLYAALSNGHGDIAAFLIERLTDVEKLMEQIIEQNPGLLRHCVENNYVECAALLLKYGAKLRVQSSEDKSKPSLYVAAEAGHVAMFNFLVSYGEMIDMSDFEGMSCLHIAARRRYPSMMWEITKHHVDMNKTYEGFTCLLFLLNTDDTKYYIEAEAKYENLAALLLKGGADPSPLLPLENYNGRGAIHSAILRGYMECVKIIMDQHPALVNQEDGWGETPLFYAIIQRKNDLVSDLLKRGARLDVTSRHPDRLGFTPLHAAAKDANVRAIELFIEAGVNPCVKDGKGKLPLQLVSRLSAQMQLAKYLCEYKKGHAASRHLLLAHNDAPAPAATALVTSERPSLILR